MSTTPKLHVIEDHAILLIVWLEGYSDLGEDFGERVHQVEAKADKILSAVCDYQKKETFKSRNEVQKSQPIIKVKQEKLKTKVGLKVRNPRVS